MPVDYHEPLDDGDIPISSHYVPDVGFVGVQGSSNINTDGSSKKSSPVNLNLKQIGDVLFTLGQKLKDGSISVTFASDQGDIPVSATSLPLPTGAATSAKQDIIIAAVDGVEAALAALATQTTLAAAKADLDTLAGIVSSNKAAVQDIEASGYIAATSPPSATNAGSDTAYTFSSQVNRVILENHTSANVYYAFDVAASAGSLKLVPGATLIYPKKCTVSHLFTAAAQNINGTADGNIVVLGAL